MFKRYFCIVVQIIHFACILLCSYILAVYIEPIIFITGFLPIKSGNVFWVYFSIISIFCFFQILFRAMIQLLFSAPMIMTSLIDILSFLPCIVLIGDIMGYFPEISYIPQRIAPVFYLGVFIALHFFFKLLTLFTSLYGRASSRWFSVIWFFMAILISYFSLLGLIQWKNSLITHRFLQVKESVGVVDKNNRVIATEVPEGSFLIQPALVPYGENCVWFIRAGNKFLSDTRIYLYILFPDKDIPAYIIPLQISKNGWTEFCLKDYLPEQRFYYILSWSSYKLPIYLVRQGLVPQLSLKSLEEARNFLFSEQKMETEIFKSIYIDGPYCEKEVLGEVVIE